MTEHLVPVDTQQRSLLAQARRRAVERLMDGQREALEVVRRSLDGGEPAEGGCNTWSAEKP
jgi:hypothetical protein